MCIILRALHVALNTAPQDGKGMSSMAAQIAGRKRWMLCAADQAEYLYNAGDVDTFKPGELVAVLDCLCGQRMRVLLFCFFCFH